MEITITEALQELKTINSKVASKQEFIKKYLARKAELRDPLAKEGGSVEMIKRERQAISDLHKRYLSIRMEIYKSNGKVTLEIGGVKRTVAEWLIWRRDVAPIIQSHYSEMSTMIERTRRLFSQQGGASQIAPYTPSRAGVAEMTGVNAPAEIEVNINEMEFQKEVESLIGIISVLDGKLSLINATTMITVPD